MLRPEPALFINFKGYLEKIRKAPIRPGGPAMNTTCSEIKDELDFHYKAAKATIEAIKVLYDMLQYRRLDLSLEASEEEIAKGFWQGLDMRTCKEG